MPRPRLPPRSSRLLLAALLLASSPAHADMLGPDHKRAGLSIHVDAELAPGQALVLLGTSELVDVVPVGVAHGFHYYWKNTNPALELYIVPAARLPELAEYIRWNNDDEIFALLRGGIACGSPLIAEPVLARASPAVELRYHYRLGTADGGCTAEFLSLDHLDAAGAVVTRDTTPPPPAVTAFDIQHPVQRPRDWVVHPGSPKRQADLTPGCGRCNMHSPHPGGLVLLALVGLARRRRAAVGPSSAVHCRE